MKDLTKVKAHVFLCYGSSCKKYGAEEVAEVIKDCLKEEGVKDAVHITKTHCNDQCKNCPILIVQPDGVWYKDVTKKVAKRIVREHIIEGRIVEEYAYHSYGHRLCDDYKLQQSAQSAQEDY